MFKKIVCSFLLICLSLVFCGCNRKSENVSTLDEIMKRKKLVIGVRVDAKPFGFLGSDNYPYGFDVDLGSMLSRYILNKYENAVEYVPVTAENRIAMLNSGRVDMLIAAMSITHNRSKIMDFSIPYYESGQVIMVPSWSRISGLNELNGKRIIIVYGSTGEINIRRALPDSIIIGYKTYDEAIKALKNNSAHALIADEAILLRYTYNDKSIKILPGRYSIEPYAIAFRKGKQSEKLREYTNFFLKDYAKSGKLAKLQHKWGLK